MSASKGIKVKVKGELPERVTIRVKKGRLSRRSGTRRG